MTHPDLSYLWKRYREGTATPGEIKALMNLLRDPEMEEAIKELIKKDIEVLDNLPIPEEDIPHFRIEEIFNRITQPTEAPIISLEQYKNKTKIWWRVAAAAAIVFIVGGYVLFFNNKTAKPQDQVSIKKTEDVQPGRNGAILTLDNGKQIILDSASNGLIAQQGNSKVIKQGEELSYQSSGKEMNVSYNTITTPKGRQYSNLILADGSKVWLDAGSSIRFPVSFSGNERKVEITGQVWFDVVHNDKMPFKVLTKGIEITDVGTEFNVNAYDDEQSIKVTLLKGAIMIQTKILKPGEQAQIAAGEQMKINSGANFEEVLAWKNGRFSFIDADIKTVMRQLSRWYDIDVVYQGKLPEQKFNGEIGRSLSLKEVLEGLAFTSEHFRIEEGRKLIIR